MSTSLSGLIPSVVQIAKDAGAVILDIYGRDDFETALKSDNSPLTAADQAANDIIVRGLSQLDLSYPIISEENKITPYSERKEYDRCWIVDPLDGTKEFIKRNGEFTVNIALAERGKIILGVVYAPILDEMYHAYLDGGAYLITTSGSRQLQADSYTDQQQGLRIVCSRSHLNDATADFVKQYDSPELVSKGSSLKFLMIAKGEADIYPRLAPTMEWDSAAAQIILEESGGSIYQFDSNTDMIYNKENLLNPYFVACGARIT